MITRYWITADDDTLFLLYEKHGNARPDTAEHAAHIIQTTKENHDGN